MTKYPKWLTSERKQRLIDLFAIYGNKCLLGHDTCRIPSHYIDNNPKAVIIGESILQPCMKRNGEYVRDNNGNILYTTVIKPKKTFINRTRTIRLYDYKIEAIINDWIADDRQARIEAEKAESLILHRLSEPKKPLRGRFSAISRDIWRSQQPLYYVVGYGISGITFKPFVKVRLHSSYMHLHVDLDDTLRGVSKNRKRKAIRYNKPLPKSIDNQVIDKINTAYKDYIG